MVQTRKLHKLEELRARTDRQLLAYLEARLDRALALAGSAQSFAEAEQIYDEVRRLLPLVKHADPGEWTRLVGRLDDLPEVLGGVSVSHPAA